MNDPNGTNSSPQDPSNSKLRPSKSNIVEDCSVNAKQPAMEKKRFNSESIEPTASGDPLAKRKVGWPKGQKRGTKITKQDDQGPLKKPLDNQNSGEHVKNVGRPQKQRLNVNKDLKSDKKSTVLRPKSKVSFIIHFKNVLSFLTFFSKIMFNIMSSQSSFAIFLFLRVIIWDNRIWEQRGL